MKIKYFDLMALKGIHSGINLAMLKILMLSVQGFERVDFYAEPAHTSICKNKWKGGKVKFHSMKLMPSKLFGEGGLMLFRDAISCLYVLKAFFFSRKDDFVLFSLAFPFAQNLIFILTNLFGRKNIYVCLHGEMEVIVDDRPFKSKNYQKLTKNILQRKSNVHYIVFGESLFKHMKHLFHSPEKVIIIEHPYEFESKDTVQMINFKPLVIGQIGMGEKSKGTKYLFELAKLLEHEIKSNLVKVKLVGKLNPKLEELDNGLVEYQTDFLDYAEFENEIDGLHLSLQLTPANKRKVTASGSFFDSIKYKKPYLSLNNEYVGYFNSLVPKSGLVFHSITDMADYVKRILSLENEEFKMQYAEWIDANDNLQQILSIENIAAKFKSQISRH